MGSEESRVNHVRTTSAAQSTIPVDTGNVNPAHRAVEPVHRINPTAEHLGGATSEQLRREIESTRSKMDETLAQLEQKLRPTSLLNGTLSLITGKSERQRAIEDSAARSLAARSLAAGASYDGDSNAAASRSSTSASNGSDTVATVVETVADAGKSLLAKAKENPIGSLLISSGLAYMAYSNSRSDRSDLQPDGHARRPVGPGSVHRDDPGPQRAGQFASGRRDENVQDEYEHDSDDEEVVAFIQNFDGLVEDQFSSVADDRYVQPIDPNQVDIDIAADSPQPVRAASEHSDFADGPANRLVLPDYADNVDHSIDDSSDLPITQASEDMTRTHDINRASMQRNQQRGQTSASQTSEQQSLFGSAADAIAGVARNTIL